MQGQLRGGPKSVREGVGAEPGHGVRQPDDRRYPAQVGPLAGRRARLPPHTRQRHRQPTPAYSSLVPDPQPATREKYDIAIKLSNLISRLRFGKRTDLEFFVISDPPWCSSRTTITPYNLPFANNSHFLHN